ncbi:MAG: glycosyltransferase [Anaerolineae bacterium]|nr:glycosyltransferase [Anaerolineae bacterium]
MRVLLIGAGEFYHVGAFFKRALAELGYECTLINEQLYTRLNSFKEKILFRLLGKQYTNYKRFNHDVFSACASKPEIILVIKGAWLSPDTIQQIRAFYTPILVNYATDDPFNLDVSTSDIVQSIPLYDFYITTKQRTISDITLAGGKNVVFIPFGYEPSLHFPEIPSSAYEIFKFSCEVCFIGAADRNRINLISKMLSRNQVKLFLYGGFWDRYSQFRHVYRGMALGRDYRLATSAAKISLGLVRHTNRDGHSMRTFEIPACGGFLLAERTKEHLMLFEEDKEAVFFSSDEELFDKINFYLMNDRSRERIRQAGLKRVRTSACTYTDRLREILNLVK